jgi:hypothetical protein
MDRERFVDVLQARRWLLIEQVVDTVIEAQEDLYALIDDLPAADRAAAIDEVEQVVDVLPPFLERRSRAQRLAEHTSSKALEGIRGREAKLAALAAARRRIWELADDAGADELSVRRMSRGLESIEQGLEDGGYPWSQETIDSYQPTIRERLDGRLWLNPPPH